MANRSAYTPLTFGTILCWATPWARDGLTEADKAALRDLDLDGTVVLSRSGVRGPFVATSGEQRMTAASPVDAVRRVLMAVPA